jgi:glucose/arabinose dehydrogenase
MGGRKTATVTFSAIILSIGYAMVCHAQSDPCSLTEWMKQLPPHTTRTLEQPPPNGPSPYLRDTTLIVNGISHKISIPAGFTMQLFIKVPQCRGLTFAPDGTLYATSLNGNIYALPDHNKDGIPDSTITVATGLNDPHGIGFYNGELYVTNNSALYHLPSTQESRVAISKDVVASLPAGGSHFSRNFVVDSTRQKFYIQVGSNSNMDFDTVNRAKILEVNPDGSGLRTYARGLRNAVGMDLDPRTGALWVNNNGMDDLFGANTERTANNPSECVYLICDGANYGWPYCYGYQMRNPQPNYVTLDTQVVMRFSGPVAEVLAHQAPLGLHFYRGHSFPSLYHNAIFQCYHGSWDRKGGFAPAPPRITVMWADSDGRNTRVTDFVNGFEPDSTPARWGRPVSVVESQDGALYMSDDLVGAIYRISYTGIQQKSVAEAPHGNLSITSISPNPARDNLLAEVAAMDEEIEIELFDVLGLPVRVEQTIDKTGDELNCRLSLSAIPSGTYILRVTAGPDVISRRIAVER